MSQCKNQNDLEFLNWEIFRIIKVLKHSFWAEILSDIHDIGAKILEKQGVFNQIYIFRFTTVFAIQKDPKLQILGQNWCHR